MIFTRILCHLPSRTEVVDKVFGLKTRNEIEEDIKKALAPAQVAQAQN